MLKMFSLAESGSRRAAAWREEESNARLRRFPHNQGRELSRREFFYLNGRNPLKSPDSEK
jgi:hypothetical protein